jgi:hypothetical protein
MAGLGKREVPLPAKCGTQISRGGRNCSPHVAMPIPKWLVVLVHDPAPAIDGQPLSGNWRAGNLAAQALQAALLICFTNGGESQCKARRLGQQGNIGPLFHRRGGVQGKSLAPGGGTDGNSTMHGRSLPTPGLNHLRWIGIQV